MLIFAVALVAAAFIVVSCCASGAVAMSGGAIASASGILALWKKLKKVPERSLSAREHF